MRIFCSHHNTIKRCIHIRNLYCRCCRQDKTKRKKIELHWGRLLLLMFCFYILYFFIYFIFMVNNCLLLALTLNLSLSISFLFFIQTFHVRLCITFFSTTTATTTKWCGSGWMFECIPAKQLFFVLYLHSLAPAICLFI